MIFVFLADLGPFPIHFLSVSEGSSAWSVGNVATTSGEVRVHFRFTFWAFQRAQALGRLEKGRFSIHFVSRGLKRLVGWKRPHNFRRGKGPFSIHFLSVSEGSSAVNSKVGQIFFVKTPPNRGTKFEQNVDLFGQPWVRLSTVNPKAGQKSDFWEASVRWCSEKTQISMLTWTVLINFGCVCYL